MFLLSFKNGDDDPNRNCFNEDYMPLVEIKDFNALIDNKLLFDQPIKNKQEAYEKRIEMPRKDNCTTVNLSDYFYHQKYDKRIGMDLSRQANMSTPQQINFIGKLEEDDGAKMLFIAIKLEKLILIFSLDSLIVTE